MLFVRKKFKNIRKELPSVVRSELEKLDDSAREVFTEEYMKKRRGMDWCYLLVFILFLHRAYLGRMKTFFLQWVLVLCFGIGLIWVAIDFLLIPSMVKTRNGEIAKEILIEQKAMTT